MDLLFTHYRADYIMCVSELLFSCFYVPLYLLNTLMNAFGTVKITVNLCWLVILSSSSSGFLLCKLFEKEWWAILN